MTFPIGTDYKANGPAVVQRLRLNVAGVIAINPEGGKTARMFAAAPEWQLRSTYQSPAVSTHSVGPAGLRS